METLPCHPVLLSAGFPLPSGCAGGLRDVSHPLFSYSSVSRKRLYSVHECAAQQPSTAQSRPVPGKRSLQPASQQAAGRNTTATQKTGHHLQHTPVCTHLPPLMGQVGNKDQTQPSGLISTRLLRCYREGKTAPRPFPATGLPCPEGASPQLCEQAQESPADSPQAL